MSLLSDLAGASFSEDRRYRYLLVRRWNPSLPDATFIMLNPSTADEHDDDPTIRKCIGFAKRWGCGGIKVVNLYAYRATQPRDCFAASDPTGGAEADAAIIHAAGSAAALGWPLVAAWGANEKGARAAEVLAWAAMRHAQCLGFTRSGQPRHPLMLSYATPLEPLLPELGGE